MRSGPDGQVGSVFHEYGESVPAALTWRLLAGCESSARGNVWLGWDSADPPGPDDLRRNAFQGGRFTPVKLADGNVWSVPVALPLDGKTHGLPERIVNVDADGLPVFQLAPEVEPIVELARKHLAAFGGEASAPPPSADTFTFCVALLGVAYRLGPDEVLALGLFGHEEVNDTVLAGIDGWLRLKAALEAITAAKAEGGKVHA
jgi:hypothetical protein